MVENGHLGGNRTLRCCHAITGIKEDALFTLYYSIDVPWAVLGNPRFPGSSEDQIKVLTRILVVSKKG